MLYFLQLAPKDACWEVLDDGIDSRGTFKRIYFTTLGAFDIISKNKEIRVPADVKGMKVGATGFRQDFMTLVGAVPVPLVPPLVYPNMQTGVVEAGIVPWDAINNFQLWEVGKYHTELGFGGTHCFFMSWDSWNKISASDQKIMMDLTPEARKVNVEELIKQIDAAKQKWAQYGRTMVKLTPAEKGLWREQFKVHWDKWISDRKAAGITNADTIFNDWESAVEKAWGGK